MSLVGNFNRGAHLLTIGLRLQGSSTELQLSLSSPGSSSSSSSSSGTGRWVTQPLARVDDAGNLMLLVQGASNCCLFKVAVQSGGTSISSSSISADSFNANYGHWQTIPLNPAN